MTVHRQTPEIIALILLFLGIALFTVVGFARDWMPAVASQHGAAVDGVVRYLLVTTGAVLVVGTLAFVAFLWRYGRGRPTASPLTTPRAERWWTLVPVLGMALIAEAGVLIKGLPVWEEVYGEPPDGAVVVELNAQQFEWIARYPGRDGVFGQTDPHRIEVAGNPLGLVGEDSAAADDIVVRGAVHLPVGRTAVIRLRSRDVLHSFSVAQFRVKQDVVPGMEIPTKFIPTRVGAYEIACAEVCGMGHYQMNGRVVVHTPEAFEAWLAEQGVRRQ